MVAICYEADGVKFVVDDDCPPQYRLRVQQLLSMLEVELESAFLDEMSEITDVVAKYRNVVDSMFVLNSMVYRLEMVLGDDNPADFKVSDKPVLERLMSDLNHLAWKWYNELYDDDDEVDDDEDDEEDDDEIRRRGCV